MNKSTPTRADQDKNPRMMARGTEDILSIIREDHKPLKSLIQVMKDEEKSLDERKQAFMEFAPLLITHAKAEEKSLYEFLKGQEDFKQDAFEGDTEHGLADQLCEEAKRTVNEDELGAKIKVLAELVEHHVREEEDDFFPKIEKAVDEQELVALSEKYIAMQSEIIAMGQDDAPAESELN